MNKNASAEDAHDAYLKLYDKVYQFDKHIARRYDGMSGGRYYITVCYLYYDGVLTDEDIREFDDEIYNKLKEDKEFFLKINNILPKVKMKITKDFLAATK